MRKAIIVHGWAGSPDDCWIPWLRGKLEERGWIVKVPLMPYPEQPRIGAWVDELTKIVKNIGGLDKDVYLIGHSIGCQTIMRYLQSVEKKIGGCLFVAGWFNLPFLATEEEKDIAKSWLKEDISLNNVKANTGKIVGIFSDDDPDVPLSDSELFRSKLGAKIIVKSGMGHFNNDSGVKELPVALDELIIMAEGK